MYSEKDTINAKSAIRKFILLYSLFALVMLGAFVAALILRTEWLLYTAAAILTVLSLFLWGNYGIKLIVWNRFLRDMDRGLEREAAGVLSTIDEEDSLKDGLEFRAVHILTGEESDKAGGRLLYVDSTRLPLSVNPGQKINCRIYGNYIKEITVLEDE